MDGKPGEVTVFAGVVSFGFSQEDGGSFFKVVHAGGSDMVAAHLVKRYSELLEIEEPGQQPEVDEGD